MRKTATFISALGFLAAALCGKNASANCTLPYQLTNGQVADATQVMADFNALADCLANQPAGSTNAVQYNAGSGALGGVGPLTDGQVVVGSTGNAPQAANLTAGFGISISNGPGTVSISATGTSFTKYTVAQAGNTFIDVPLGADGGYAYHIFVKGSPTANASIEFRISSDGGTTFYSGSSDYKWGGSGSDSLVNLSGTAVGSDRQTLLDMTLAGMNVAATERFVLTGTVMSASSTGSPINSHIGGENNALAAADFNAIRIFASAGTMDNFAVYVGRLY